MDRRDFEEACKRLSSEGFNVISARLDEQAFGSWFIDTSDDATRMRRLVWDGKDGWLILQTMRENEWRDVWIAREREQQTLDHIISEMRMRGGDDL